MTPVEKQMAMIDKILNEKLVLWAIKVREPIQELYNMNPEFGIECQDKYLGVAKEVTGKNEKPFLPPKK